MNPIRWIRDLSRSVDVKFKFILFLYSCYLVHSVKLRTATNDHSTRPARDKAATRVSVNKKSGICWEKEKFQPWLDFYYLVNTSVHVICSIYYLSFGLKILEPGTRFYCYSPRPIYTRYLEPKHNLLLACVFSVLAIGWRWVMRFWRADLELDIVSFVLQDEGDFIGSLRLHQQTNKQATGGHLERHFGPYRYAAVHHAAGSPTTSSLLPVTEVMYYPFQNPLTNRLELVLRPNRTKKARRFFLQSLHRKFELASLSSTIFGCIYILLVSCWVVMEQSEITRLHCQTLGQTPHWARLLGSLFISIIYVVDGGPTFLFNLSLVSALIMDLEVYLAHIERRIQTLKRRLIARRAAAGEQMELDKCQSKQQQQQVCSQCFESSGLQRGRGQSLEDETPPMETRIFLDISRLHASLSDFFAHVRRTDRFISLMVAYTMFLWFGFNALVTATGLQLETRRRSSPSVRVLQLMIFLLIWQLNRQLLAFKTRVESTYAHLCSLMALDPTKARLARATRTTNRWISVMSFYSSRQRASYSFTLLGTGRIYSRLTFLTVISYTISSVFLLESFSGNADRPTT